MQRGNNDVYETRLKEIAVLWEPRRFSEIFSRWRLDLVMSVETKLSLGTYSRLEQVET